MKYVLALEEFLSYLRINRNASPKTATQYEFHLWKFLEFVEPSACHEATSLLSHPQIFLWSSEDPSQRSLKMQAKMLLRTNTRLEVQNLTEGDLQEFRLYLVDKGLSVKSANAYMITFRSFFKFLKKKWHASLDPTTIDLIKVPDRQVTFLSQEEIERLFLTASGDTIQNIRDRAILECIYSTGLRISELTALNRSHISWGTREFSIRGKWGKVRIVYLTSDAANKIHAYLQARDDSFSPLFIRHNYNAEDIKSSQLTDDSVRLTRFFITEMIRKRAVLAGIPKNISAHTLRHSFATTLLQNGADIRSIQEMLGHASITTTQVYTHVTNPQLREIHKKYHGD